MPLERVNHSQLARAAGVSRSTVSRALQNHPAISDPVRQKIQKLAAKMGYRPNPLVSALMASRNQAHAQSDVTTLALLTAWPDAVPRSPTFRDLFQGVRERAESTGFRVEQFWFNHPHLTGRRLSQILMNRGIVAVLLGPLPRDQKELGLDWEHFSLSYFTPNPNIPLLHRSSAFNFRSACIAVRRLLELGYQRPCLVLRKHIAAYVFDQWIGGYFAVISDQPRPNWIMPHVRDRFEPKSFATWCQRTRPDVILSNDQTLHGWLKEMKLPVAYASLDRHREDVGIAGIDQQSARVGAAAVDIITGQINRNERGIPVAPSNVLLEGRWVDAASAPRRK